MGLSDLAAALNRYTEYDGTLIYNVSVVNQQYRPVRSPTVIDIGDS